jgi:hypothetical protein
MTDREAINRLTMLVGALYQHLRDTTNTEHFNHRQFTEDLLAIHEATRTTPTGGPQV